MPRVLSDYDNPVRLRPCISEQTSVFTSHMSLALDQDQRTILLKPFVYCDAEPSPMPIQVKRNVQRTLAGELQKLSIAFRKQQKQHLNRLRQRDGGGEGSFLADGGAASAALADDDYDPGFTDVQVGSVSHGSYTCLPTLADAQSAQPESTSVWGL